MAKGSLSSGSSGAAYSSSGGLGSMGSAMNAPIGGLGGVSGTAAYSGGFGVAPATYGGGYFGSVGDSRGFGALSPRAKAYLEGGGGGRYSDWLRGPQGGGTPRGGFGAEEEDYMAQMQQILARMFQPIQPGGGPYG
jgi:hypothetical protein